MRADGRSQLPTVTAKNTQEVTMTITELRQSEDYRICMDKIRRYKTGFEFTIPFYKMSIGQANAMRRILQDAHDEGLIESVSCSFGLDLGTTEETWRRL